MTTFRAFESFADVENAVWDDIIDLLEHSYDQMCGEDRVNFTDKEREKMKDRLRDVRVANLSRRASQPKTQ